MKMLVTAAALATLLASPAFAQTQSRQAPDLQSTARAAPAPLPAYEEESGYGSYASSGYGVVIEGGMAIGADPDPRVGLELRRDQGNADAGW